MNIPAAQPPFLGPEEKVQYLVSRHYFDSARFKDDDFEKMKGINFHYFLGYARNSRYLHDNGALRVSKSPGEVFDIIERDTVMSGYVFGGVREVELRMRHLLVDAMASCASPYGDYLDIENYVSFSERFSAQSLVDGLLRDIVSYREAFVVSHLDEECKRKGLELPDRVGAHNREMVGDLVRELPIWAVVDSFTLGHLIRVMFTFVPPASEQRLWRDVGSALDFKLNRFEPACKSMLFMRNLVAHHGRLWMRPTSDTPTAKGVFRKSMSGADPRSMLIALYNLASLHGPEKRRQFAAGFEEILDSNHAYEVGIRSISPDGAD